MPLSIRVTGLDQAKAIVARWDPLAYIAAVSEPAATTMLESLRLFINIKTGKTRDTLGVAQAGSHLLFDGDAVAGYLASGTRPHIIRPKTERRKVDGRWKGGVLAWGGSAEGNAAFFARVVHHPGTRPYDYPQRAADAAMPTIAQIARAQALQQLTGGV